MPYLGVGQREGANFDSQGGSPQILRCPSDSGATAFDHTSYAFSAALYHSPASLAQLRLRNLIPGLNDPGAGALTQTQTESQMEQPSRKAVFAEWLNSHDHSGKATGFWGTLQPGLLPGPDRWNGSRNLAFGDGHARKTKARALAPSPDDCPDINLTPGGIAGSDL
jgi:prepilin-type processing-associated H-X9-DG protein